MYRRGIVQEINAARAVVRVRFPDREGLVSWWLEVLFPKTHKDKAYWMPDIGEHVACLLDEHGEAGCVLGALYSMADTPPAQNADKAHLAWDGGASAEYDRATKTMAIILPEGGTLNITAPGGVTLNVNGGCLINAQDGGVTINGDALVNGSISATGDISDATSSIQEMRNIYNSHIHGSGPEATQKME